MAVALTVALAVALAVFANHLGASPMSGTRSSGRCVDFTVPITATAQNGVYGFVNVDSDTDAAIYAVQADTWDSSARVPSRNITVSDTFNIAASFCPGSSKKNYLHIPTHGGGFDRRYWDVTIDPTEYSYVEAALNAGYSVLTYDRLSTGRSDKPDVNTAQAPMEVEILRHLTEMARSGEILDHVAGSDGDDISFDKIIHVGHSYGSAITAGLLGTYGDLSDGAVLTGYIPNKEFAAPKSAGLAPEYAPQQDPTLFAESKQGYVNVGTIHSLQTNFFSSFRNESAGLGGFTDELLEHAWSIRQPITTTGIPSIQQLSIGFSPGFTGCLQFFLAEFDFLICEGHCEGTYDSVQVASLYPNAKDVNIYTQLGTGHGLAMHRGARKGYEATFAWLEQNGL